jgi:hypothetical protein
MPGLPEAGKYDVAQFLDHLADEVLPPLITAQQ